MPKKPLKMSATVVSPAMAVADYNLYYAESN